MNSIETLSHTLASAILIALPTVAFASNGLLVTGYGTESVLMGGADVAVARDAFAAASNPAGLTQLHGQDAAVTLVGYTQPGTTHTDSFGNYRKPDVTGNGVYGDMAYARRLPDSPFAIGVALVVQGGQGWAYRGLNTVFGTRDDASSRFGFIKLAPAVAYKFSDQWSLGLALGVNEFLGDEALFPHTSTATFSGFHFRDAKGIGINYKLGLQYHPTDDMTLGLTYGTQTSVPLKGGSLEVNYTNTIPGLGVVRYDNAKLNGLRLPQEVAVGVSFRPVKPLLISLQDKYYNWSNAITKLELTATNPRNPSAPPVVLIPSVLNFDNQHVIEIGLAYDYSNDILLMAGLNYGSRPIPDQSVNPLFAGITASHYMFGVKRQLDRGWNVTGGLEVLPLQSVTYNSPIFGKNANERNYSFEIYLSVGRNW